MNQRLPKKGSIARVMIDAITKSGKRGLSRRSILKKAFKFLGKEFDRKRHSNYYTHYFWLGNCYTNNSPWQNRTVTGDQGNGFIAYLCCKNSAGKWVRQNHVYKHSI